MVPRRYLSAAIIAACYFWRMCLHRTANKASANDDCGEEQPSLPAKRRFGTSVIEVAHEILDDIDNLPADAACLSGGISIYLQTPISLSKQRINLVQTLGVDKFGKAVPVCNLPLKVEEGWYHLQRFGVGSAVPRC